MGLPRNRPQHPGEREVRRIAEQRIPEVWLQVMAIINRQGDTEDLKGRDMAAAVKRAADDAGKARESQRQARRRNR